MIHEWTRIFTNDSRTAIRGSTLIPDKSIELIGCRAPRAKPLSAPLPGVYRVGFLKRGEMMGIVTDPGGIR